MLKHNPKLKKLWDKAKKTKLDCGYIRLDNRAKSTQNFLKEFSNSLPKVTDEGEIDAIINLINFAFKKEK